MWNLTVTPVECVSLWYWKHTYVLPFATPTFCTNEIRWPQIGDSYLPFVRHIFKGVSLMVEYKALRQQRSGMFYTDLVGDILDGKRIYLNVFSQEIQFYLYVIEHRFIVGFGFIIKTLCWLCWPKSKQKTCELGHKGNQEYPRMSNNGLRSQFVMELCHFDRMTESPRWYAAIVVLTCLCFTRLRQMDRSKVCLID